MDLRQYFASTAISLKALMWSCSSALIQAKDLNGKSIFEGRRLTGLSNAEENQYGLPIEVGRRYISALQRERVLTSNAPLGPWFLFRGRDREARRKVRVCSTLGAPRRGGRSAVYRTKPRLCETVGEQNCARFEEAVKPKVKS